MKVLVVCSANSPDFSFERSQAFVCEQMKAVAEHDGSVEFNLFLLKGRGVSGYLSQYAAFRREMKAFRPDLIHAHYGLCGLFANLQRAVPVVTTYHGSDVNIARSRRFSRLSVRLSAANIFVSDKLLSKMSASGRSYVIPCGVSVSDFPRVDMKSARKSMHLPEEGRIVLFSSGFDVAVKNPSLAKEAVSLLKDVLLVELKGYDRREVNLMLNACDAALLTSFSEGSPQFVKEALAASCPIVSVDVGDVCKMIGGVEGCHIAEYDASDIASKLLLAFGCRDRSGGWERIKELGLENTDIAERVMSVYREAVSNNITV